MAATIVYEGVGSGGELFRGQRFCLLQRVPMRSRFVGLVEANGGEVVKMEKQADIVIGDHARKDQPPGSVSYTFIEDCIKRGRLVDVDNHRAGPVQGTVRQVGSSQPAKKGRTPFTDEDDRVLMKWCVKAERKGGTLGGNEIYKDLEAINNRHTWQSWRDRWVKYVSSKPRPEISAEASDESDVEDEDEEGAAEEVEEPAPTHRPAPRGPRGLQVSGQRVPVSRSSVLRSTPQPRAAIRRPPSPPQDTAMSSPRSTISNGLPKIQKSAGGYVFSEEETEELVRQHDHIQNIPEDQLIDAWVAFANEFPNHTAQEWRNHYAEYVVPKMTGSKKRKGTNSSPQIHTVQTIPGPSGSNATQRRRSEVKDSQGSGETLEQSSSEQKGVDLVSPEEVDFEKELSLIAENWPDVKFDFEPTICGRTTRLFHLWQALESDEIGGYDKVKELNLWNLLARRLNFSVIKHPTAAKELKDCVVKGILADYALFKSQEDELSLTDSQLIEAQLQGAANDDTHVDDMMDDDEEDDDLDQPQSTPRRPYNYSPSSKHSLERTRRDTPTKKRQKIDKGKGKEREIPSTPEDIINGSFHRPPIQSSPLKFTSTRPDPGSDEDSDGGAEDDLFIRDRPRSTATIPAARVQEPETQDFTYSRAQLDEPIMIDDSTPSPPIPLPPTPSPPSGSVRLLNHQKVNVPSSSAIPSTSENANPAILEKRRKVAADWQALVDKYVNSGYAVDDVWLGLKATSMTDNKATEVMDHQHIGQGIPAETKGIWYWTDDLAFDPQNGKGSSAWSATVNKHGIKFVVDRKQFLRKNRWLLGRLDAYLETQQYRHGKRFEDSF